MAAVKSLRAALQLALDTAAEQPREVPELPQGWPAEAQLALAADDEQAMLSCALRIARAHSQYRAEFDIKGWLHELRMTLYPQLRN